MTPAVRWSADARTDEAAACIEEALDLGHFDHYAQLVGELPLLLGRHGLGQTLAYLVMRGGGRESSPHELVYRQVTRRLAQLYPLSNDDLLTHLTRVDSKQYLRLAEETRLFAQALYAEIDALEDAAYEGTQEIP